MNAWDLQNKVSQRVPGYTQSEYLEVCNEAYQELWVLTSTLVSDYFTDQAIVTVAAQAKEFDLRYNTNGKLSAAIHPKIYQIDRIRVLQPGAANWLPGTPRTWTDASRQGSEQDANNPVSTTSPYYYAVFGRGILQFTRPLPVGASIEVIYTTGYFEMAIVSNGTVSNAGTAVTGSGTTFTQLLPPDFLPDYLPSVTNIESDIEAELVVNPGAAGQLNYQVATLSNDTALNLVKTPSPTLSGAAYALGTVPDIPESHHRLILDIATRNLLAHPAVANDARFSYWDQKANRGLARYADAVIERQHQEADRRQRFPMGAVRRTTAYDAR